RILSGSMTMGSFLTYIFTLVSIYDPIRKLSRSNNAFQQAFAAGTRVFSVLEDHTEMTDRPKAVEVGPLKSAIEFRDVSFKYDDASIPALRNINLTVKAGEVVAIVGASGAGKSTLTNLLMRY